MYISPILQNPVARLSSGSWLASHTLTSTPIVQVLLGDYGEIAYSIACVSGYLHRDTWRYCVSLCTVSTIAGDIIHDSFINRYSHTEKTYKEAKKIIRTMLAGHPAILDVPDSNRQRFG